jgi:hypothetical protein
MGCIAAKIHVRMVNGLRRSGNDPIFTCAHNRTAGGKKLGGKVVQEGGEQY